MKAVIGLIVAISVPALSVLAAQDPKEICECIEAEPICNFGLGCVEPGFECQRCNTNPNDKWCRCIEVEETETCHRETGLDPTPCGTRFIGTCVSDGMGGAVCVGFASGSCGNLNNVCEQQ